MALWTSGLGRIAFLASAGLTVIAVAAVIASLVGGDSWDGAIGLLQALILIATCGVIAVGVFDQSSVNAQSVLGAVSIYLLLGMFFTMVYGAVAVLGSGDLFAQGTDGTLATRMYFSYVTMTTVGYGDYTTSGNLAHTISIIGGADRAAVPGHRARRARQPARPAPRQPTEQPFIPGG